MKAPQLGNELWWSDFVNSISSTLAKECTTQAEAALRLEVTVFISTQKDTESSHNSKWQTETNRNSNNILDQARGNHWQDGNNIQQGKVLYLFLLASWLTKTASMVYTVKQRCHFHKSELYLLTETPKSETSARAYLINECLTKPQRQAVFPAPTWHIPPSYWLHGNDVAHTLEDRARLNDVKLGWKSWCKICNVLFVTVRIW